MIVTSSTLSPSRRFVDARRSRGTRRSLTSTATIPGFRPSSRTSSATVWCSGTALFRPFSSISIVIACIAVEDSRAALHPQEGALQVRALREREEGGMVGRCAGELQEEDLALGRVRRLGEVVDEG